MKKTQLFLFMFFFILLYSCKEEDLTVKSIVLDKTTLSLFIDDIHQFKVTHLPNDLPIPNYIWETSDISVVTINKDGEAKAISVGEATITVYDTNKVLKSECKITVFPIKATSITLYPNELELDIDEEETLTYKIEPENSTDKKIFWSSEDINIATIDNNGKVKGISVGETRISVKTSDVTSNFCNVKIKPIKATSISLDINNLSLEMNDIVALVVKFQPENTTNKKIHWSSSDNSIATVSENGEVLGCFEGNCIITAKSDDGGYIAICNIEVKIKGLTLTKSSINIIPNDQLSICAYYETTQEKYDKAKWTSSNPSVASVEYDTNTNMAIISSYNIGRTEITATSFDGTKTAICYVNVNTINHYINIVAANPQSISSSSSSNTSKIGCKIQNSSDYTVYIEAVLLLDESNLILQNALPPWGHVVDWNPNGYNYLRYFSNGYKVMFFEPVTLKGNWSFTDNVLSKYSVVVQYSFQDKYYNMSKNVNINTIGGLY